MPFSLFFFPKKRMVTYGTITQYTLTCTVPDGTVTKPSMATWTFAPTSPLDVATPVRRILYSLGPGLGFLPYLTYSTVAHTKHTPNHNGPLRPPEAECGTYPYGVKSALG